MLPFNKSFGNYILLTVGLAAIALLVAIPFFKPSWLRAALTKFRGPNTTKTTRGDEENLLDGAAPMAGTVPFRDDEDVEMMTLGDLGGQTTNQGG
ncbi:hypothetical protein QBC34DRAFT_444418 [Podospora aff. communis PSN243]|uniref:Uncharacterized protein n=1 Tax=Podospora aff. communis PSN243 TaxID=3040156 RepID=A0AAV9FXG8_9PEZI|nr:hypothetical protein QBC34DRAFT_444418 [Podospora aff. communis PSN243]